jgi:hypothetical protein
MALSGKEQSSPTTFSGLSDPDNWLLRHSGDSTLKNFTSRLLPEEETALKRFRSYVEENGFYEVLEDRQSAVDDTTLL